MLRATSFLLLLLALIHTAAASAHVVAQPSFIATGESSTVRLTGPNERDQPMTGFSVTVPSGVEIVHAHPVDGWSETTHGRTATWTGGSLASRSEETFRIGLEASVEPGTVALEIEQLYDGGEIVRWPVSLTVVPPPEGASQNLGLAAAVGLIGLLVVVAVVVLSWWRRSGSLQER
jgi:uncharacterized protein YcnI